MAGDRARSKRQAQEHEQVKGQVQRPMMASAETLPTYLPLSNGTLKFVRFWLAYATPQPKKEVWRMSEVERIRQRQADIAALTLLLFMLMAGVSCVITGVMTILSLQAVTVADVLVSALFVIVTGTVFPWLNRRGHIEWVGFGCGVLIMLLVLAAIIAGDYPSPGIDWIDAPGLDLMVIGLFVGGMILRPRNVVVLFIVYCLLVGSFFLIIPRAPDLLPVDHSYGLLTPALPAKWQLVGVIVDFTYRPLLLALFAAFSSVGGRLVILLALESSDAQALLAKQQQGEIVRATLRTEWAARNSALLEKTLSNGMRFIPLEVPVGLQSASMTTNYHMLLLAGTRIAEHQKAADALQRLANHASALPQAELALQEQKSHFADEGEAKILSALALITGPLIDSGTGSLVGDRFIVDLDFYLKLIAQEIDEMTQEIIMVIQSAKHGERNKRVSMEHYHTFLGEIAINVNLFLDSILPSQSSDMRYRSPFDRTPGVSDRADVEHELASE